MNSDQHHIWNSPSYYFKNLDKKSNQLYQQKKDSLIQELTKTGIFSNQKRGDLEKGKTCMRNSKDFNFWSITNCFPDLLIRQTMLFENQINPFEEECKKLSKISRGQFNPNNIRDNFEEALKLENDTISFSFELNGEVYSKDFTYSSEFLDFINESLEDQKIDSAFYEIEDFGGIWGYIFLTQEQYDFFEQNIFIFTFKRDLPDLTN